MHFISSPSAVRQVVSLLLVSTLLFSYLGEAQAFQPDNLALWFFRLSNRNKTHWAITRDAIAQLDRSYFNLLPTQPLTQNMDSAIVEIATANAEVDTPPQLGGKQFFLSASHFDGENFPGSMRRLVEYKAEVVKRINIDDVTKARWYLGQALHTLQDFYSHSNWVERGETNIWSALGNTVSPFPPRNLNTCKDCSRDNCPDDDCDYIPGTSTTNLTTNALTTGYYGGEDRNHNFNRFKCDHGGDPIDRFGGHHPDTSGTGDKRDGINKDTEECQFSPHFLKHTDAVNLARAATVKYIDDIKNIVGLTKMRRLLGGGPTLAFAVDTTGSMFQEIEAVKAKIKDIVNSRIGTPLEASNYALAPFNDPNFGPITVTADRVKFLQALDNLTADGGGDCPELAYTAIRELVFSKGLKDADLIVFTDAGAKDVNLARSANFFASAGRVRVSFVYTGEGLLGCPISEEYFTTAKETGGKVFEIAPSEIPNVTILAELMGRPNLVGIWSFAGLLNGFTQTFFFRLDTTLTVATLVVTGTGATNIVIRRPDGTILQPSDFVSYVPLSTGLLASISSPVAGLWSISISGSPPSSPQTFNPSAPENPTPNEAGGQEPASPTAPESNSTSSNGEFSIGVFGESEVLRFTRFEFVEAAGHGPHVGGFSINSSPPAGQTSLVVGEMVLNSQSAPQFELRGQDGAILQTFPLEMVDVTTDEGTLAQLPRQFVGEITVPTVPFNIYATGLDANGVPYQRLVSGLVKPQSVQVKPVNIELLYPGLITTYTVQVKNLGPAGSFVVSASDDQGFVTGSPTTVTLAQNATANVNFQVSVPSVAKPQTLDNFSFTAQSTTDPTLNNTLKVGPLTVDDIPQLKLGTVTLTPLGGNGNAFLEPGESGSLSVELINKSSVELTGISATLTSTSPGLTFTSNQSLYEDLLPDGFANNTTPFAFNFAGNATCGQILNFTLTVNYTGGSGQSVFNFSITTGQPTATTTASYTGPAVAIPDNNAVGINVPLTVSGIPAILGDIDFRFDGSFCSNAQGSNTVGLDHTFVGDLVIKLTSPQGTTVTLINRAGGSGNNFCNTVLDDEGGESSIQSISFSGAPYSGTFTPAQPLAAFRGQDPNGTWILNVSDRAAADIGNVRAFSLLLSGLQCGSASPPPILSDDFNDNSLDTSRWTANDLFSGFIDLSIPINETGQRLEIGPLLQNASGSHYRGIRTVNSYDFTGAYSHVELVQPASSATKADAMFTIGYDVNNYYRIYVSEGNLIGLKKIGGVKTTLFTLSYDSTNHRYLRIRHDATTNSVLLETAPSTGAGPGTWTQRHSETWNSAVQLSATQFELKAGTWQPETNAPGTVIFDNFEFGLNSPPAAPLTVTSVCPASGSSDGGTPVTISGTGFLTNVTVRFGGVLATNVQVTSGSTLIATTPAHAVGSVDVSVTNASGQSASLANGYTYTSPPPAGVILEEDFNDNCLNTLKWTPNNLFSGFIDLSLPINETMQRLEIGPLLLNASGSHYRGIRTISRYDFSGAYSYVELVQPASSATKADAMFTIGYDVDNYYRIYVSEGNLIGLKKLGGVKTTLFTLSYDSTNHRYLRIRHDAVTNSVVLETAPSAGSGPGSWVQRHSETWNSAVQLSAIQFEVKGGTWQAETNAPGKVIFDSFLISR